MQKLKILFSFLISIVFGGVAFIYVGNTIGWSSILKSFEMLFTLNSFLIVVLSFFIALLGVLRWREIIKDEGVQNKISLFRLFRFYIAGFSITYIFPIIILGSEFYRASLLKHKEKVSWDKALASVIIERIIEWTINVLIILLGAFYFFFRIAKPSENILLIFGISFLITIIILLIVYLYIFRKKSLLKKFVSKISGENFGTQIEKILFEYFDFKKLKLWKGYFLSLLKVSAMLLRVWLIMFFLGNVLDFMPSLSILSFSFLSTLIPIPATLGVQELIQSFAFENLNIDLTNSMIFTMLLRSGDVIVSVTGFVLFFKAGYDFLKSKIFKNEK